MYNDLYTATEDFQESVNHVVVTGMGIVTSVGQDIDSYWTALVNGDSAFHEYGALAGTHVATVEGNSWESELRGSNRRYTDRAGKFALVCAQQAIRSAGITLCHRPRRKNDYKLSVEQQNIQDRIGVYIGSSIGGVSSLCLPCAQRDNSFPESGGYVSNRCKSWDTSFL